jgi:uncharacterized membrane protein YccC
VVMGPISFWGNVVQRVLERVAGTVCGSLSGLLALRLEVYSLPLMLVWCAVTMFVCGYLTLGKRPYMALLIGITMGVVCGAAPADIETAMWRSCDVVFGSLLALLFTSIYAQKACIHWRMQMASYFVALNKLYSAWSSPNMLERPRLEHRLKATLAQVVKMRTLISPACKESHIPRDIFEAIQTISRNLLCTMELLADAYWSSRESHFLMLNAQTLRNTQLLTLDALSELSEFLLTGSAWQELTFIDKLETASDELQLLMRELNSSELETAVYGYVWLSMQLAAQLKEMADLISLTMRK